MTKKQTELSEELREAVFEAARAGAAEAYTQNTGYVNYFKAMETLLYNYKKLAALVADEEAYCEVEYHAGRKTFSTTPQAKGFIQRKTEAEIVEEMREEKQMQKAQQEEIKTRFNSRRSTGALLASIKVSAVKEIDGGKRVEIYPNGKDKHGVRNAEKGFVLNYGRSNMPARPWFTAANEKAADDVVSEMRRVWEEKQNEER